MRKPNKAKCALKFMYLYWPGFGKNKLKFRFCQIYKTLKMNKIFCYVRSKK